jgi:protein-disulfide isomerase
MRAALALLLLMPAIAPAQRTVEGNAASRVRVLIYEDLACSDCATFRRMLDDSLLARFGGSAAFEHRDFPLAKHASARPAAILARYFDMLKPGLGIEWRRHMLSKAGQKPEPKLEEEVAAFAKKHNANAGDALASLNDPKLAGAVERDYQDGVARGVAKTPTVFVAGKPFIETFTLEEISKAIEQAIRQAN